MDAKIKTDVVLVVKGAGIHKPDDTLNIFLKGLIPAIKSQFPKAKIRQKLQFCKSIWHWIKMKSVN